MPILPRTLGKQHSVVPDPRAAADIEWGKKTTLVAATARQSVVALADGGPALPRELKYRAPIGPSGSKVLGIPCITAFEFGRTKKYVRDVIGFASRATA